MQLTPPGSACSIAIGEGLGSDVPPGTLDVIRRLDAREKESPVPVASPPEDGSPVAVPALFAMAPPRVLWIDPDPDSGTGPVLELRAADRLGLLSRVSAVLEGQGVDIVWATVETLGGTVVDTFCLRLSDDSPRRRSELAAAVIAVVPPPEPPREAENAAPTSDSSRGGVPGA